MNYSAYRLRVERGTIPPGILCFAWHQDGERLYCGKLYGGNLKHVRVIFLTTRKVSRRGAKVTVAPSWVSQLYFIPAPRRMLFHVQATQRFTHAPHADR